MNDQCRRDDARDAAQGGPVRVATLVNQVLQRYGYLDSQRGGAMSRQPTQTRRRSLLPDDTAATDAPEARAKRILKLRQRARELYAEIDRELAALARTHAPAAGQRCGPAILLSATQAFRLIDPFIDGTTGGPTKLWKQTPVSRYDSEVSTL